MSFRAGFQQGMRAFGERVGIIVNTCLLLIAYCIGVGLPALLGKLVGKRFLETGKRDSYWDELHLEQDTEGCYRQF